MKELSEHSERKKQQKKRKAKQQGNNKYLAKVNAKELKSSTPTSDDSRISTIKKRLTVLENLVCTFLALNEAEDLQGGILPTCVLLLVE